MVKKSGKTCVTPTACTAATTTTTTTSTSSSSGTLKEERKKKIATQTVDETSSVSRNVAVDAVPAIPSSQDASQSTQNVADPYAQPAESCNMTKTRFKDIQPAIDSLIIQSLQENFNFEYATEIQAKAIPPLLEGKSLKAQAETGGGKTLAFVIPMIHHMRAMRVRAKYGTYGLILTPTRELALQIDGVMEKLLAPALFRGQFTVACVMGGFKVASEAARLERGANVVVGTPGRVLDHLQRTPRLWNVNGLRTLVLDEADRLLEQGFEETLQRILELLPTTEGRQTLFFSATQDHARLTELAREAFRGCTTQPIELSTLKHSSDVVDSLTHGFVEVDANYKFLLLYALVKKYQKEKKKVILFFASCNEVRFFTDLLNYIDVPCVGLHGQLAQSVRNTVYLQFCNTESALLLTTDVAARGLDFPHVDSVIQYDPPDSIPKYIHRVGRTARAGRQGNALIFLLPQECQAFLAVLTMHLSKPVNQFAFDVNRLNVALQDELKRLISKNYYLHRSAHEAYKAFIQSYATHSLKSVYDVYALDLSKVAAGFGLSEPPLIDLGLGEAALRRRSGHRIQNKRSRESKD